MEGVHAAARNGEGDLRVLQDPVAVREVTPFLPVEVGHQDDLPRQDRDV
jgi:hypothetical protein